MRCRDSSTSPPSRHIPLQPLCSPLQHLAAPCSPLQPFAAPCSYPYKPLQLPLHLPHNPGQAQPLLACRSGAARLARAEQNLGCTSTWLAGRRHLHVQCPALFICGIRLHTCTHARCACDVAIVLAHMSSQHDLAGSAWVRAWLRRAPMAPQHRAPPVSSSCGVARCPSRRQRQARLRVATARAPSLARPPPACWRLWCVACGGAT